MQKIYTVVIKGKGGHASMPQKANNPILIAAGLIMQLCTNQETAGVKVVGWESGDKGNIIPEQAKIWLKMQRQGLSEQSLHFCREYVKTCNAEIEIQNTK